MDRDQIRRPGGQGQVCKSVARLRSCATAAVSGHMRRQKLITTIKPASAEATGKVQHASLAAYKAHHRSVGAVRDCGHLIDDTLAESPAKSSSESQLLRNSRWGVGASWPEPHPEARRLIRRLGV
jgi:hypothetical protein